MARLKRSRGQADMVGSTSAVVDLTGEEKDYLSELPPELLHIIISYLFPTHEPDRAFDDYFGRHLKKPAATHPLDYLAATCKIIRAEVMNWAFHFHSQHQAITNYKPLKTAKLQAQRNFLRGRGGILTWAEKNCVFCGKKTSHSAILMNNLRCCCRCDGREWPGKITKTYAKDRFDLKDHHLLPHKSISSVSAKLLAEHPGLPRLWYGTCMTVNTPTTMFLTADVTRLARLVHGDLKAHLAQRERDREQRRLKIRENRAKRQADMFAAAREAERAEDPESDLEIIEEIVEPSTSARGSSARVEGEEVMESSSAARGAQNGGIEWTTIWEDLEAQ